MALLLVFGSITINAAGLDTDYSYIIYDDATGIMLVSNEPIKYGIVGRTSGTGVITNYPFNSVGTYTTGTKNILCWYSKYTLGFNEHKITADGFVLVPVEVNGNIEYGVYEASRVTISDAYAIFIVTDTQSGTTVAYKQDPILNFPGGNLSANYNFSYNGTIAGELPEDIGGKSPEDIVNETLNATTNVSDQANVYITNITQVYNSYVNGGTSLEQAKAEISANMEDLADLAESPTATLKDAVNVTNALTYGQVVNDTLLQEEEEAYWNERDIDSSVSQDIQQSDQQEIDYLEDLIAETEKSISELSPSANFTSQQIQTATEIVDGIWENPIVKKIIPLAACFMVVCVVLGVKYRL